MRKVASTTRGSPKTRSRSSARSSPCFGWPGVAPEALSQPHEVRHGRVHLWDAATKTMTGTMEASDASGQQSQMKSVVEYKDAGTRVFTMYMTV